MKTPKKIIVSKKYLQARRTKGNFNLRYMDKRMKKDKMIERRRNKIKRHIKKRKN